MGPEGGGADHEPVVKLFNPCGAGTWLLSELDPEFPDECGFGLADLGFGTPELGSIGLLELTEYRGPFGLGIVSRPVTSLTPAISPRRSHPLQRMPPRPGEPEPSVGGA